MGRLRFNTVFFFLLALIAPRCLLGATISSSRSGTWSSTGLAPFSSLPDFDDDVVISTGHTVGITDSTRAKAKSISVQGTLRWNVTSGTATLAVGGGSITVKAGGKLQIASTDGAPLTDSAVAQVILSSGSSAGIYGGIVIENGGMFIVNGSTKNPYALASADAAKNATSLTVNSSSVTGWAVGDAITIGQTERASTSQTEKRTIASLSGGTIGLDSALSYAHYATNTIIVANLTRNAVIKSSNASNSQIGYIRNLTASATNFVVNYGEFNGLGVDQGNIYGIVFDSGTYPNGQGSIANSSIHDGYTGVYINRTSSVTLTYNDIYANGSTGIAVVSSSHSVIIGNSVAGSPQGLSGTADQWNSISGNYFCSNSTGTSFYISANNALSGNRFFGNTGNGLTIQGAWNFLTANNTAHNNENYGIYLSTAWFFGTIPVSNNTVSSNTVYGNGSHGISLAGATGLSLANNTIHSNNNHGLYMLNTATTAITGNIVSSNTISGAGVASGIFATGSSSNTFSGNAVSHNEAYGTYWDNGSNLNSLNGNSVFSNAYRGLYILQSASNTLSNNSIYSNSGGGIDLEYATGTVLTGNWIYGHTGSSHGIRVFYGFNNSFSSNTIYSNGGSGLYLYHADYPGSLTIIASRIYGNSSVAINVLRSSAVISDSWLGWDPGGASAADSSGEIYFGDRGGITLRNTQINPDTGIATSTFNGADRSVISYRHNGTTGETHLWGDYKVEGGTISLEYAGNLYASSATTPTLVRRLAGTDHAATVISVNDSYTLTEKITITYKSSWTVSGSLSGVLGSFNDNAIINSAGQYFPNPSAPKLKLKFIQGSSPSEGDRIEFLTLAASGDSNTQKKLYFHSADSTFNNGYSRLGIEPSGVFYATGTSVYPTLINLADGGTYYTLSSSGTLYTQFANISNIDPTGLQLNAIGPAGSVGISSVTFDYIGVGPSGQTSAYLRLRNLYSTATMDHVRFNLSRSTSGANAAYNVNVTGTESNLAWTMTNPLGPFAGDALESGSNNVDWAPTMPEDFRIGSAQISSITWIWSDIRGEGNYKVYSTTSDNPSVQLAIGTTEWAEVSLSTNALYARYLRAANGYGSVISPFISSYTLTAPPTGFSILDVRSSSIAVQWSANTNPTYTNYRVAYWTDAGSTSTLTTTYSTATVTGLNPGVKYSLQLYSVNGDTIATSALSDPMVVTTSATFQSITTGAWGDPTTWSLARAPLTSDAVTITTGTTVTINQDAEIQSLSVYGLLQWTPAAASATLTMNGGDIVIYAGGSIRMGTSASSLRPGTTATIILSTGTAGQYGLIVRPGGSLVMAGTTKSPYTTATADIAAGASSLSVDASSATNWGAGDFITVSQTSLSSTSQTEKKKITAISGGNITVDSAFSYPHLATSTIYVANLTRNAVIRSSGTQTAYIQNLAAAATDFDLRYSELEGLGTLASGKYGITFDSSSAKGRLLFNSIHDGLFGIVLNGSSGVWLLANNFYANSLGIDLFNYASSNTINGNIVSKSANQGLYSSASSSNTFIDNLVYSNGNNGITLDQGSHNILKGNRSFANNGTGFYLNNAGFNAISDGAASINTSNGLYALNAASNTIASNRFYENNENGIYLNAADKNTAVDNILYSNNGHGIRIAGAADHLLSGNFIYSNGNYGFNIGGGSTATLVNTVFGYNASGESAPDFSAEIYFAGAGHVTLKNSAINPYAGVSTASLTGVGRAILSLRQNSAAGETHLWGNYAVETATMTLSYASALYASTATAPRIIRTAAGTEPSLQITATNDSNTLTELIIATYSASSGRWSLYGSSSGALGSFANASALTNEAFPNSSSPKLYLNFSPGSSPTDGDRMDFMTLAGAGDASVQKKLHFHQAHTTFNSSHSRLIVKPGAGFEAVGSASRPTLINMAEGGTYYTLISSGAFNILFSSFNNLDQNGLQLGGSGATVSLSSSSFDYIGLPSAEGSSSAYITARDLSSSATFYSMAFNLSRSTISPAFNVKVEGDDSALSWYFRQPSGALSGESHDNDPNGKIGWSMTQIGAMTGTGLGVSSISWTWTDVDGETGYRVLSSSGGNMSGELAANTVSWTEPGLSTNAAVTRQLAAFNSNETSYAAAVVVYTLAAPPTGLAFAQVNISSFVVAWGANTNPSSDTSYRLAYWEAGGSTTSVTSSGLTKAINGLASGATYFVQVYAVNGSGQETASQEAAVSTRTTEAPPTAAVSFAGSAIGVSSITWSWTDAEGELGYRVLSSSGGNMSGSLAAGASTWTETELSTNTVYGRVIEAFNNYGSSVTLTTVTVYTQAAPPNNLSFTAVYMTSMTVAWSFNSNPAATNFRTYLWQIGGSTSTTAVIGVSSTTLDGLSAGTTYYLTVRAVNGDGAVSRAPTAISTITAMVPSASVTIDPASAATLTFGPPSGSITIEVPANTFSESLTMTASLPSSNYPAANSAAAVLSGTNVGLEITLSKNLQPLQEVTINVAYRASDVTGRDESRLLLARYDTSRSVWIPLASTLDAVNRSVTGKTNHFSLFQIMEATPGSTVDSIVVFPNPFNKTKGHTSVTFSNLPASTNLKIYTTVGEMVRELTADNAGLASWDVKNQAGSEAASGVYFVLAQSPSGEKKIFKVAIQR
ncbi:MAG: right-handed parallel beta-helix repeat-containing protein [Elusimicrobia bacterium]|nr:right-handed parallel beta-helix repeat-containing protein [Elusimicrobiota bacterium]